MAQNKACPLVRIPFYILKYPVYVQHIHDVKVKLSLTIKEREEEIGQVISPSNVGL